MGILNRKKLVERAQVIVGGVVRQAGILNCVLSVCRGGSRPASAGTSPTGTMYLPGRWTAYRAYSKKVSTHTLWGLHGMVFYRRGAGQHCSSGGGARLGCTDTFE